MMNDALLQYMADINPIGLQYQMISLLEDRARVKLQALNDDDLMEAYDYVSELAEHRRAEQEKQRRIVKKGGEQ